MASKYWEERRKTEEKQINVVITNKDKDKIDVKSEFDKRFNILRIEIKLKGGFKK